MPPAPGSLDDAVLAAASSQGLLRRARRDVEAGRARLISHGQEEAQVEVDGEQVTLRPGGLAAARCSCPLGEICRHILAAVLLLRASAADAVEADAAPAAPSAGSAVAQILAFTPGELEKAFGRTLLARAARTLPGAEDVTVTSSGSVCVVRLPGAEVRYLAGPGLTGMLPAEASRMQRAQALLAVRRLHLPVSAAPPVPAKPAGRTRPARAPPATQLLAEAGALVLSWARAGLAAAPLPLQDRLFDGAVQARAAGFFRLAAELRRLSEDVRRRRGRQADLSAAASLRAAARTLALIEALRRAPADLALRGQARESYEPVGELRLIGGGYEIWSTPAGARGATAHFYAPAARRWFTASLARAAGQDPGFVPQEAVLATSVWGTTLARASGAAVTLTKAAAAVSGRLSLANGVQAAVAPVQLRREALADWEGSFSDWSALDAFIRARFAPSLRAALRGTTVAVLLPARTGRPAFDEVAQELVLPLADRQRRRLQIRVLNLPHLTRRLMALQEILGRSPPEAYFVTVAVAGERLHISPYALLTEPGGALLCLDAPGAAPAEQDAPALSDWLRRGIAQLGTDRPRPAGAPRSASMGALTAALDALLGLCELGGRMHDPHLLRRLTALAQLLGQAGLRPVALLLQAVVDAADEDRPQAVLVAVHAISSTLQLLRLPIA